MLGPILLTILAVVLLGFAVWLWPRRAPDTASTLPAPTRAPTPNPDPKTAYLSRGDMFQSVDQRGAPTSAPTEFLMQPDSASTPATEYLSREEIFEPAAPPKISADHDTDDSLPTAMFSRETLAANPRKPPQ